MDRAAADGSPRSCGSTVAVVRATATVLLGAEASALLVRDFHFAPSAAETPSREAFGLFGVFPSAALHGRPAGGSFRIVAAAGAIAVLHSGHLGEEKVSG
jgi:hypothetical protein